MSSGPQKYASVPQNEAPELPAHNSEEFELESLDLPRNSADQHELNDLQREAAALDPESQDDSAKSNMRMAFMNMANSILGAGIIGQPYAFKNSGLVGGIIVLIILTILIDWTLRLIVINATMSNTHSYQDTVFYCYGKYGRILLLVAISSFAYGGCMAFCVIIGDTIPHVLKAFIPRSVTSLPAISWLFQRNSIIIIFTTCISYPLSLNRDISKLAKASGFALIGMLIIVIIAAVRGPFADPSLKAPLTKLEWTVNLRSIFQGISVISFALVCHHNTIFIYNSLERATISKFAKLTHIACGVSMICCLVMGVDGLLNFGGNTKGNILNNFKSDDNWINIARFCFGLNMLTTFPLEVFVVRDVIKDIILTGDGANASTAHLELSSRQHFLITTFLVFSTMSVSLVTCNLGIILELIGSTSASLMAYIIPPLCYLKLKYSRIDYKSLNTSGKRDFILSTALPTIGCAIFGCLVMFISSYSSIRDSIHDKNAGHCVEE
ncbi:vacuolar amino acid transporter 2 [[Candida] railenensis]|uniref:Vacuolar amino acid transporter 2 n=1 Tax=[Candida] railenensis TaxID=45579 RepID=A0A9P0QQA7_9ASCO|nr:vacuolar amino acid transporter 2 [[Candida] railenensis]